MTVINEFMINGIGKEAPLPDPFGLFIINSMPVNGEVYEQENEEPLIGLAFGVSDAIGEGYKKTVTLVPAPIALSYSEAIATGSAYKVYMAFAGLVAEAEATATPQKILFAPSANAEGIVEATGKGILWKLGFASIEATAEILGDANLIKRPSPVALICESSIVGSPTIFNILPAPEDRQIILLRADREIVVPRPDREIVL